MHYLFKTTARTNTLNEYFFQIYFSLLQSCFQNFIFFIFVEKLEVQIFDFFSLRKKSNEVRT